MPFILDIAHPGQPSSRFELPAGSYTIGRSEACKIRLRHPEISERHSLLTLRESLVTIEDLHSSNGTTVDGVPIQEATPVHEDDVIGIGPCLLRVSSSAKAPGWSPAPADSGAAAQGSAPEVSAPPPVPSLQPSTSTPPPAPPPADPMAAIVREINGDSAGQLGSEPKPRRLFRPTTTVNRI